MIGKTINVMPTANSTFTDERCVRRVSCTSHASLCICSPRSVDLDHYFLIYSSCACTHNSSYRLCDLSLLADNTAHVVGGYMKMIYDNSLFVGSVLVHADCRLVLDQSRCDDFEKFFHNILVSSANADISLRLMILPLSDDGTGAANKRSEHRPYGSLRIYLFS